MLLVLFTIVSARLDSIMLTMLFSGYNIDTPCHCLFSRQGGSHPCPLTNNVYIRLGWLCWLAVGEPALWYRDLDKVSRCPGWPDSDCLAGWLTLLPYLLVHNWEDFDRQFPWQAEGAGPPSPPPAGPPGLPGLAGLENNKHQTAFIPPGPSAALRSPGWRQIMRYQTALSPGCRSPGNQIQLYSAPAPIGSWLWSSCDIRTQSNRVTVGGISQAASRQANTARPDFYGGNQFSFLGLF